MQGKALTQAQQKRNDQASAANRLRLILPIGSTIYSVQRWTSRTGMSARFEFFAVSNGRIENITGLICIVQDFKRHDNDGIQVNGTGFSKGGQIVEDLGVALFPEGFTETNEITLRRFPNTNIDELGRRNVFSQQHGSRAFKHEKL